MEVAGRLEGLQAYEIHGTRYYRVFYSLADDPENILQCQLPFDALYLGAKAGDAIILTVLLTTVMGITPRAEG